MLAYPFAQLVTSREALRAIVGEPWELNVCKQLPALDAHCRAFVGRCPFLLIGTDDATGRCDVLPRGDPPRFVLALDDKTLVIPERPGNRRADTLHNILEHSRVGLLFLIPGMDETLRVNGRAALVRDDAILNRATVHGKRPTLGIAVEVEECFLHCGRSFQRARLRDATSWPERGALPSLAQMLMDQAKPSDVTLQKLEHEVEDAYTRLYQQRRPDSNRRKEQALTMHATAAVASMVVELGTESAPALIRWSVRGRASYWLRTAQGPVLIDPQVSDSSGIEQSLALPEEAPIATVLTNDWHERDAYRLHDRWGTPVWAPTAGLPERGGELEGTPDHVYEEGTALPGGCAPKPFRAPSQENICCGGGRRPARACCSPAMP